jgi:hypothetical protein
MSLLCYYIQWFDLPIISCLTLSMTDCAHCILLICCAMTVLRHGRLNVQISRSHTDIPHSVEPLWTRDRPFAETATWHQTTLTIDKTSVPPLGFKAATTAGERPQTDASDQRFSIFFQAGTTFISQNVLRTTPLLSPLKANLSFF